MRKVLTTTTYYLLLTTYYLLLTATAHYLAATCGTLVDGQLDLLGRKDHPAVQLSVETKPLGVGSRCRVNVRIRIGFVLGLV